MQPRKAGFGWAAPVVTGVLIVTAWHFGVRLSGVPESFLPSPGAVLRALFEERAVLWESTLTTLVETLSGVLLAVISALVWALALDRSRLLRRALTPYLVASQTVPIIVLAPLMLLWFGFGLLPKTLLVALFAFFPIVLSTLAGLDATPPERRDLMRSYAATPAQVFALVRFPAAVPFLFTSLKLAAAAALVGALVAETESNNRRGLGFQILGQVQSGNVADVWILLLVSALLGVGLVGLVGLLQRFLAPWERR